MLSSEGVTAVAGTLSSMKFSVPYYYYLFSLTHWVVLEIH